MSHPLQMPGFTGGLPLASNKNLYPAYYQGPNLSDGILAPTSFVRDTFAVSGYLLRKPRVVRLVVIETDGNADLVYYMDAGPFLAGDAKLTNNNVAVVWGTVPYSQQGTSQWFLNSEGSHGYYNAENENWILQTARPGDPGLPAPHDMIAGSIYLLVFQVNVSVVAVLQDDPIGGNYASSYSSFVAKFPCFEKFKCRWYYQWHDPDADDYNARATDLVNGSGSFAGMPLVPYGFDFTITDLYASYVAYIDLLPDIYDFFGIPP
jgi:hypothetical protein